MAAWTPRKRCRVKGASRFGKDGKGFEGAEYRCGPAPAGAGRVGRATGGKGGTMLRFAGFSLGVSGDWTDLEGASALG